MDDAADAVLATVRELVAKKRSARELVEVLRKLTCYSPPATAPALDALLAVLQQLKTNRQSGEENKAIRAAYQCLAATLTAHPVEAMQGTLVMHQLRGIDLKDDLLPRKLAALLLYADLAVRFPLVEAATSFPSGVLRPMLVAAAAAVQDAATPGKVASLTGKHRRTHDLDCFAAPAVFAALCTVVGGELPDGPALLPYLAPALTCDDADVSRVASAALARAALRGGVAAPQRAPGGLPTTEAPPEAQLLLAVVAAAAPDADQWQTPRVAQSSLAAGGEQQSSFWGRKAASQPIGSPPTSLNTADAAAVRSYLRAAAALSGICVSSEHAAALNAAAPSDAPPVMYAAHIASGVAGSGGATSHVLGAYDGGSLATREAVDAASKCLRLRGALGGGGSHDFCVPLPPHPASAMLLDAALSRDPGSPTAAHAEAYGAVVAALGDPRPGVRLEAARLLACGGLPRLLAHSKGAASRPSRGVPLQPRADSVARIRAVATSIRQTLHVCVAEGAVPLMCTALRAAISFGVALSAFEGQAILQLRRAVVRATAAANTDGAAGPPRPLGRAGAASPHSSAAASVEVIRSGFQLLASCAVAASLLVDALCRVILLADGGADSPARGVLAHPCSLALKALLWCCPAFVLSVPRAQHVSRRATSPERSTADDLIATLLGVALPSPAAPASSLALPAWQAVRSALTDALTDEHLRMLRDARRASLAALQDIPQRVQSADMREWLRCLGDRAVAYTRVGGPVVALVAALPLLWFRQRCGRYAAGIDGAGDAPSCAAPPGPRESPGWSGVPPLAWPGTSPEADAESVAAAALRRGVPISAVRDDSGTAAPLGLFLRLLAGPDAAAAAAARSPLLLVRSGRTPPMALETLVASWDVLRWLALPGRTGGTQAASTPPAAAMPAVATVAATGAADSGGDIFGIAALSSALTQTQVQRRHAGRIDCGVCVTETGSAALLASALLLVSDPAPFPSAHAAYSAGRAAAALHAQLTGLVAAAGEAGAYFVSSPKLKRCVHGVATARRPPDLAGAALLGWPLLGGVQPAAAASAAWELLEARARSLAAFYLRAYAQPQPAGTTSPAGARLWCSGSLLLPRLAALRSGGDGVEGSSGGGGGLGLTPASRVDAWRFPLKPAPEASPARDAALALLLEAESDAPPHGSQPAPPLQRPATAGAAAAAFTANGRCGGGRPSTFEERLLGLEDEQEARSRAAWARLVVAAACGAQGGS